MPREQFARRVPSADPPSARLSADEMADYIRLCGLGENLERAATRWAREQAERDLWVRQRHGGAIVLAAVVIGTAIALLCLMISPRLSGRPRLPPSVEA